MGLKSWLRRYLGVVDPVATVHVEAPQRPGLSVGLEALARARAKGGAGISPFKVDLSTIHPPQATPSAGMAMDSYEMPAYEWAASVSVESAIAEGQAFLGYPLLSELAQRPEYRRISETIAGEMTSKWIKFVAKGEEDKSERIAKIEEEFERLSVRDVFREVAEQDGFFGRGHIFIDLGEEIDGELKTPIAGRSGKPMRAKIAKGSLKALKTVEAVWCYPMAYNAINPLSDDWYKPSEWYVMGTGVHASRLITIVGREVPDMLKPSYSFGGLSLSQMARPYVDNWLETRQAVNDIIRAFSVMVLKTNMAEKLATNPTGEELFIRAEFFNKLRDNRGLMMIDKEQEDFDNVSAPLSSLDALQAQSQEHLASVSGIPLVKLLGIQPAGLNASSEGELQSFYDWIKSQQEKLFRKPLEYVLTIVQLSLFGDADDQITFEFESLWDMSDKEKAEIENIEAQTDVLLVDSGIISTEESRRRIANDKHSSHQGLDPDDAPEPPMPEGVGENDGPPAPPEELPE